MYARELLKKKKVTKLRSMLRRGRHELESYEESGKFTKDRLMQKFKRFEKVCCVSDYEMELEKGMEPIFLKEKPFVEKDDKRCYLLQKLEPYTEVKNRRKLAKARSLDLDLKHNSLHRLGKVTAELRNTA